MEGTRGRDDGSRKKGERVGRMEGEIAKRKRGIEVCKYLGRTKSRERERERERVEEKMGGGKQVGKQRERGKTELSVMNGRKESFHGWSERARDNMTCDERVHTPTPTHHSPRHIKKHIYTHSKNHG